MYQQEFERGTGKVTRAHLAAYELVDYVDCGEAVAAARTGGLLQGGPDQAQQQRQLGLVHAQGSARIRHHLRQRSRKVSTAS
jgi:hypothetical protein